MKASLLLAVAVLLSGVAFGQDGDPHARGWRPPTSAEKAWADAHMVITSSVRLNSLALSRINAERQKNCLQPLSAAAAGVVADGQEALGNTATELAALPADTALSTAAAPNLAPTDLPRQVDNSQLKYFPPIRSQGSFDSCTSFSTTYYTLTFMVGRANDWDVRSDTSRQMSPKFTFNLGNLGGANSTDGTAASIMQTHGCATWAEFPYDSDATSFPTSAAIWRSATRYRTSAFGYLTKVDTDTGLLQLKAMVANGYLLNFGTGAPTGYNEWSNTTLKNDPATTNDDAFTGQLVGYQVEGTSHEMTVVGYNDDVWCDINGNGVVDPGEKGALKIANSWGSGWGNSGFIWLSYDALKRTSAVPGWVGPAGRINAFFANQAIWISARSGGYAPTLLAECVLSHGARSQLVVSAGHGSTSALTPDFTRALSAFNMSGALSFSGTMVFDLSDFADAGPAYRWFVGFNDTTSDTSTGTLQSVKLTDGLGNLLATCATTIPAGGYPLSFNGNTVWAYANLQFSDTTPPATVTDLSATATPTQIQLYWTAPGDDGNNGVTKSYEIRYSSAPITTLNWATATVCANPPQPGPAGTPQKFTISSLAPGSVWYAALKAMDEAGNTSLLSNVAQVTLPLQLSITTASSLPAANLNQSYSTTLSATGGVPPYTWKPAAGYVETVQSPGVLTPGTAQNWHSDSSSWTLTFANGFKFPFCGIPTSTVSVSTSGNLQFYELIPTYGTSMLCPFWTGLSTSKPSEDIFVDSAADHVTIRWCAHPTSQPTAEGTVNFQVALYSDGRIQFTYGDVSTNTAYIGTFSGSPDWTTSSVYSNSAIPTGTTTLLSLSQMPTGLNLNPTTGVLSGTPTVAGKYGFNIAVSDNADVRVTQRVSKTFSLTINSAPPPVIASPLTATGTVGTSFSYQITASNSPTTFNATGLPAGLAVNTSTGVISGTPTTAGTLSVTISATNASGTGSATLVLTVNAANQPPVITSAATASPNPATVNGIVAFLVAASDPNSDALSYSWAFGDGGTATGASATHVFAAVGSYLATVTVSDGHGHTVSSTVTVTVNAAVVAPAITTQPANRTVTAGQTATFSVVASGTAPLSYQWQKNGSNISGATSTSYVTPATSIADSGTTFRCVVSNSAGSATSNNAILTVNAAVVAPAITTQPTNQTVTAGQTATFSIVASGTAPLLYQWQKNGSNISGATSASYATPATTVADSASTFRCVVSNSAGSATSNNATLTVNTSSTPGLIKLRALDQSGMEVVGAKIDVYVNGVWQSYFTGSQVQLSVGSSYYFRGDYQNLLGSNSYLAIGATTTEIDVPFWKATLLAQDQNGTNVGASLTVYNSSSNPYSPGATFTAPKGVVVHIAGMLNGATGPWNSYTFTTGLNNAVVPFWKATLMAQDQSGTNVAASLKIYGSPSNPYSPGAAFTAPKGAIIFASGTLNGISGGWNSYVFSTGLNSVVVPFRSVLFQAVATDGTTLVPNAKIEIYVSTLGTFANNTSQALPSPVSTYARVWLGSTLIANWTSISVTVSTTLIKIPTSYTTSAPSISSPSVGTSDNLSTPNESINLGSVKENQLFKLKLPLPINFPHSGKFKSSASGLPLGVRICGDVIGGRARHSGIYTFDIKFVEKMTSSSPGGKHVATTVQATQQYTLTVTP